MKTKNDLELQWLDRCIGGLHVDAFVATLDVPEADIRQGDLVLSGVGSTLSDGRLDAGIRGPWTRLPRARFATLSLSCLTLRPLRDRHGCPSREFPDDTVRRLWAYLADPQYRRFKDESSPIYVVRTLDLLISRPIEAGSDQEAIFELLCQISGPGGPSVAR